MSLFKLSESVYVNSVYVDKIDLCFNQFIVRGNTGKLIIIETGLSSCFDELCMNIESAGLDTNNISSIIVPHFEVDEMGAIGDFIKKSPKISVFAHPICSHGISDIFKIKCRPVNDHQQINIDGVDFLFLHTKHVHQWDSMIVLMENENILFSSDIFIQKGRFDGAINFSDAKEKVYKEIEFGGYLPSAKYFKMAITKIESVHPRFIAPMHGSSLIMNNDQSLKDIINFSDSIEF